MYHPRVIPEMCINGDDLCNGVPCTLELLVKPIEKNPTDMSGNLGAIAEDEDEENVVVEQQEKEKEETNQKKKKPKRDDDIILHSGLTKKDVELLSKFFSWVS